MDEGRLQAWLDGARAGLDAEERAAIEEHVRSCRACAARAETLLESTRRATSALAPAKVTDEEIPAFEGVVARARSLESAERWRRPWVTAGWAASVAVALSAGWFANELSRMPVEPTPAPARVADGSGAEESPAGGVPPSGDEVSPSAGGAGNSEEVPLPAAGAPERTARTESAAPNEAAAPIDVAMPSLAPPAEGAAPTLAVREPAAESDETAKAGPVVLSGRVTDEAGRPLESAQVVVEGTGVGALTGPDGTFALSLAAPAGSVPSEATLRVVLIGYLEASRQVALGATDPAPHEFQLQTTALALQELVVRGTVADPTAGDSPTAAMFEAPVVVPELEAAPERWRPTTRAEAEAFVGFALRNVPELDVVTVAVGTSEGRPVARIVQALEAGRMLTLFQSSRALRFVERESDPDYAGTTLRSGEVWVAAMAPLPADSLSALLSRLR